MEKDILQIDRMKFRIDKPAIKVRHWLGCPVKPFLVCAAVCRRN